LALAVALLLGAAARAEAAPSRTKRDRPVAVTVNTAEPLPELHVAPDVPTVLLFPADIRTKTLTVDQSRIRVRDVGQSSIIVQAVDDYRADERQELEVFFADGRAPARAAFVLVMDPAEVDTRIDVERRELPNGACPAEEPRTTMSAVDAIASGVIDKDGVLTRQVEGFQDAASGFDSKAGVSYRARTWVLVDVEIIPPPRYPSWRPSGATLTSKRGEARVRTVKVEPSESELGAVRVLVETDVPPPSLGLEFTLHLNGPEGAPSFSIPTVKLPPAKESKP
jgi:uncharacterized protein (TIGR02268 family)